MISLLPVQPLMKCTFGASELEFLDHHINGSGITPLQDKVQAIRDFPQPDT